MDFFQESELKVNAGCTIASMMRLMLEFISIEEAQGIAFRQIAQEVENFKTVQKRIGEIYGK